MNIQPIFFFLYLSHICIKEIGFIIIHNLSYSVNFSKKIIKKKKNQKSVMGGVEPPTVR